MTDLFQTSYPSDWQTLLWRTPLTWVVPLALILAALWLLYPWYQRGRAEKRVRSSIARLGKSALRDVSLDNGMEGFVFIDYLVLTPREILVVTWMNARGIVFGAEKIDQWARVMGRRTFKFPNPLLASQERVLAVKYHVSDAEARGVVLFDEGCSFPKGQPEGVLLSRDITGDAAQWEQTEIPPKIQADWDKLAELASRGAETYSRDVLLLRGHASRVREVFAAVFIALAVAWGGAHLFFS